LEEDELAIFVHKRLANGAAPDLAGWTGELVQVLVNDEVCLAGLHALVLDIANGSLVEDARALLLASKLIAVPKGDDGVRPIAIGSTFYKLAALLCMKEVRPAFASLFEPIQLGVGVEGGPERASLLIRTKLDSCGDKGCIVSCDFKNAFNSRDRSTIAKAVYNHGDVAPIWNIFDWAYRSPSQLVVVQGGKVVASFASSDGVRQGDPLASLGYALSVHDVYVVIAKRHPKVLVTAIIDDLTLTGPADAVADAFEDLVKGLSSTPHDSQRREVKVLVAVAR
jgi:NAD(P)H-dependent FMN reductase